MDVDLSLEELENLSHDMGSSTPGSRRVAASPGLAAAAVVVGNENAPPAQAKAGLWAKVGLGVGSKQQALVPANKPGIAQPREARSQARILELEETVDELEGKLRAEASNKHELSMQIRKIKVSLAEQEQLRCAADDAAADARHEGHLQQEGWERIRKELNARINLLTEEKSELGEELQAVRDSKRLMCEDYEGRLKSIRKENTRLLKRHNGQEVPDSSTGPDLGMQVQNLEAQLEEARRSLDKVMADADSKLSKEVQRRHKAEAAILQPGGSGGGGGVSSDSAAQIEELKAMLAERESQIASQLKRIAAVEPWQKQGADAREKIVEEIAADTAKIRKALKAAVDDNKLLNDELDRQGEDMAKLEKRLARGEYNSSRTLLLAPKSVPPCSKCAGLQARLTAAVAERDAATAMLESAKHNVLDCDESLDHGLRLAEVNKALAEKEKYISRLSEQAKAQIQEYKEVAKALFGYSLSKHKASGDKGHGQYQVKSLFAVHSSDIILVQAQDGGKQVDMLGSDYSMRLKDHADRFFQEASRFPPLPALLASITIEHYARCVD